MRFQYDSPDRSGRGRIDPSLFIDVPGVEIKPAAESIPTPSRYIHVMTDEDLHRLIDLACRDDAGELRPGVVPMLQIYALDVGFAPTLASLMQISRQLYDSIPYEDGAVEIDMIDGTLALSAWRACTRQLRITLNGRLCPLMRVYHATETGKEQKLVVPLVENARPNPLSP